MGENNAHLRRSVRQKTLPARFRQPINNFVRQKRARISLDDHELYEEQSEDTDYRPREQDENSDDHSFRQEVRRQDDSPEKRVGYSPVQEADHPDDPANNPRVGHSSEQDGEEPEESGDGTNDDRSANDRQTPGNAADPEDANNNETHEDAGDNANNSETHEDAGDSVNNSETHEDAGDSANNSDSANEGQNREQNEDSNVFPGEEYEGPYRIRLKRGRIVRSSNTSAHVTINYYVSTSMKCPCEREDCRKLVNVGKWGIMGCGSKVCVHCGAKREGDWDGVGYGFMGKEDLLRHLNTTHCRKARGMSTNKRSFKQIIGEQMYYKINNPEFMEFKDKNGQRKKFYKCFVCSSSVLYRSRHSHHFNVHVENYRAS